MARTPLDATWPQELVLHSATEHHALAATSTRMPEELSSRREAAAVAASPAQREELGAVITGCEVADLRRAQADVARFVALGAVEHYAAAE